jgi:O-antigen ligase
MNESLEFPASIATAELGLRRFASLGFWAATLLILLLFSTYAPLWALPALFVFIGGVIAVFANPYVGSLLILFLIYSRMLQSFDIGRVFMAIVALTAVAWIVKMAFKLDFRVIVLRKQAILIIAFLFLIWLSVPFAHDTKQAFTSVFMYLKLALLYVILTNLLTTPRRFELCIYTVIFSLIVSSVYGFYDFFTQPSVIKGVLQRVSGGGTDPNFFATSIVAFIPLPFFFIFEEKRVGRKIFWMGILLLLIAGILSSFSRGGILGLAFVLLLLIYKKRNHRALFWLAIGVIVALVFFLPGQLFERMETLSNLSRDQSLRWRYKLALGAWDLFLTHPLTGIGVGNFILFSFQFTNQHQFAHNTYLEILAEIGIFALLISALLLWVTFRYLRDSCKSFARNKQTRLLAVIGEGLEVGLWGFLFVALFLSLHFDYMLWVFFGLVGALRHIAEWKISP